MSTKIYLLLFAAATFLFSGCNNYLDKSPDSELDVEIDTEEKIAELLTGGLMLAGLPFLLDCKFFKL
mgnify:CR=1 FL=1